MKQGYVARRFQDLVEEFIYHETEEPEAIIKFKDEDLVPAVLNNYKDIVLQTSDGPLSIYKRQFGRVEGLSDSFAKLTLEQRDQILELVRKFGKSSGA